VEGGAMGLGLWMVVMWALDCARLQYVGPAPHNTPTLPCPRLTLPSKTPLFQPTLPSKSLCSPPIKTHASKPRLQQHISLFYFYGIFDMDVSCMSLIKISFFVSFQGNIRCE
jgi:hypothetical protein